MGGQEHAASAAVHLHDVMPHELMGKEGAGDVLLSNPNREQLISVAKECPRSSGKPGSMV